MGAAPTGPLEKITKIRAAGQGRDAQKLLFQPILRHSDFCVKDLQTYQPASYRVAQQVTKNAVYMITQVAWGWARLAMWKAGQARWQEQQCQERQNDQM